MMLELLNLDSAPLGGLLMVTTSHEDRCRGVTEKISSSSWRPRHAIVVSYTEMNERRELNRRRLLDDLEKAGVEYTEDLIDDSRGLDGAAVASTAVRTLMSRFGQQRLFIDVSVLTRRHLLILLRWLWFNGAYAKTVFFYSEPREYIVHPWLPMSFGVRSVEAIPGFPSIANPSRPLHLAVELGFEGDRAFAVYEALQPSRTTLFISDNRIRPGLAEKALRMNQLLIESVGPERLRKLPALDPTLVRFELELILGEDLRPGSEYVCAICSFGTKMQAIGTFEMVMNATNPPSLLYAAPLRHNQHFYSEGIGATWYYSRTLK